jgi:hypothetical protein
MHSETSRDLAECEVGGYLVRSRRTDAWDAIVALLVALDTEHNRYFHAVMQGCRRLSNSTPEIDGLDDLLMAPEQHLHDVAIERERRRSRRGYTTPADARAFLQMARRAPHRLGASTSTGPNAGNPIATAYFRAAEEDDEETPAGTSAGAPGSASASDATKVSAPGDDDIPASIDAVIELLTEAGVMPQRPRALLETAGEDPRAARLPLLRRLMEFALHHDETAYLARNRELAFLANTLMAGCSVQSRPFTAQEAADAAACICNLGLECWPARWPGAASPAASSPREPGPDRPPDAFLVEHDLVAAFEVGWSVLYRDVSLFVADQLISTLADLRGLDADTDRGLNALRRTLAKRRETPWLARDAADVIAVLDMTAWISVLGLLDECPILPAALTAVLERRTTSVSQTAFEFISTTAQIGDVRIFMRALPAVLSS